MVCTPSAQSCTQECHALVKDLFARARAARMLQEANCQDLRCSLLLEVSRQRDVRAGVTCSAGGLTVSVAVRVWVPWPVPEVKVIVAGP